MDVDCLPGNKSSRKGALVLLSCGVLAVGLAQFGVSGQTRAAGAMSTLDKVEAELEINQQVATFALMVDGDGETKRDFKAAVDKTFAPNDVFDAYSGETLGNHVEGRDAFDQFAKRTALPDGATIVARHFVTPTIFDEMTPTTAKTRTASFVLKVSKNMIGADCKKFGEDTCGGKVVGAYTYTYHTTWVKNADGWQMSHIVVRGDE